MVDVSDEKEEQNVLFWAKTTACAYPWFWSLLDELAAYFEAVPWILLV
jgi:hypothetical protein